MMPITTSSSTSVNPCRCFFMAPLPPVTINQPFERVAFSDSVTLAPAEQQAQYLGNTGATTDEPCVIEFFFLDFQAGAYRRFQWAEKTTLRSSIKAAKDAMSSARRCDTWR